MIMFPHRAVNLLPEGRASMARESGNRSRSMSPIS
jgi:hypothetical protein